MKVILGRVDQQNSYRDGSMIELMECASNFCMEDVRVTAIDFIPVLNANSSVVTHKASEMF